MRRSPLGRIQVGKASDLSGLAGLGLLGQGVGFGALDVGQAFHRALAKQATLVLASRAAPGAVIDAGLAQLICECLLGRWAFTATVLRPATELPPARAANRRNLTMAEMYVRSTLSTYGHPSFASVPNPRTELGHW